MADEFARQMRRQPADAERKLWNTLRRRELAGYKFRRQVPLGPYIADFVCLERRLIIEVDGGQHAERLSQDQKRSRWLQSQNFKILRVWNNDVLQNIEGVLAVIRNALESED